MTATTDAKGTNIGVLNTVPATGYSGMPRLTGGEGAGGRLVSFEDAVAIPATNVDAGSWFRLIRVPARLKLKKFEIASDGVIDNTTTTATLKMAFGLMFSDAYSVTGFKDGTPMSYDNLVPALAANGTTVATPVTANANDVFAAAFGAGNFGAGAQVAIPWTDLTFKNIANLTTAPGLLAALQTPLFDLFNFTDGLGHAWADAGYFDIYGRITVAATTPAAANLVSRVSGVLD